MNRRDAGWFERPRPARTAPHRGAANFYRAAPGDATGAAGGVPLDSVEAVLVAAVRTGYKIAEAQVDRSARLAQRLRQAGDRAAGPGSDRQALDATEQLVFRAMMSGLGWFEGVAADRGNPLRRAASAQYRLLGSLLGLTSSDEPEARPGAPEPSSTHARGSDPPRPTSRASRRPRAVESPQIRHTGSERRPVRVRQWELGPDTPPGDYRVVLYGPDAATGTIDGVLTVRRRHVAVLTLETRRDAKRGVWRAAVCDEPGTQVGYIEVEL
jgi:hypothetical protein